MAKATTKQKAQHPIMTYLIIFIIGFISGIAFSAFKLNPGTTSSTSADQHTTEQHASETATAMQNLEAEVTANPENFQAWVQLGHLYFDTQQYEKAITAYTTSLKYHSGDANLLTDLGVMYRRTDRSEKAIELFEQAQAMDPSHVTSRLNEGIVRHYDLGDTEGAIASWQEALQIDPDTKIGNGETLQSFVDKIKKDFEQQKSK